MSVKHCCDHSREIAELRHTLGTVLAYYRATVDPEEKAGSGIGITRISPAPNVVAFAPRKGRTA